MHNCKFEARLLIAYTNRIEFKIYSDTGIRHEQIKMLLVDVHYDAASIQHRGNCCGM